ncbi:MAG: hypothetical protein R2839_10560 [Thermomicrobiales bacterium]
MTPDAHPVIGRTHIEGLTSPLGSAVRVSKKRLAVGLCLAAEITGHEPPVDLTPFDPHRFESADWDHPWSDTEYTFSSDFGHKF